MNEHLPFGIVLLSPQLKIVAHNNCAREILGIGTSSQSPGGLTELNMTEDAINQIRQFAANKNGSGQLSIPKVQINRSAVEDRWVEVWITRRNPTAAAQFLLTIRDTTELEKERKEARSTQTFLDGIIDMNPYPIFIGKVATGFCTRFNPASVELFGSPPPPDNNIYNDPMMAQAGLTEEFAKTREGKTVKLPEFLYDAHTLLSEIPSKPIYIKIIAYPIADETGKLDNLLVMVEDTSERKRAEISMQKSEAQYRAIVEDQTELICRFGSAGSVTFANRAYCARFGVSRDQLSGDSFWNHIHSEDKGALSEAMERLEASEPSALIEHRILAANGSVRWVNSTFRRLRNVLPGLEFHEFQSVSHDVTEQRKFQEELRQSQKLEVVGTLAGGIAHDFNNVLQIIIGWADNILRQTDTDATTSQAAEAIAAAGRRGVALARQLLGISRRQEFTPTVFDLNTVIQNLSPILRRLAGESVEVEFKLPDSPAFIYADEGQMEQVLMNLCVNARDAMPNGGDLLIRLSNPSGGSQRDNLLLEVKDSGIGMDAETMKRAFEPFFTTKTEGRGTGLGLSIVSRVIQQARGSIDVSSQPNQGAHFSIQFPGVPSSENKLPESYDSDEVQPAGIETILLVEDEPEVLRALENGLEKFGFEVLTAPNGVAALSLFEENHDRIDLVVTDVLMPGMDGGEFALKLRQLAPELKIYFLSGYADAETIQQPIEQTGIELLAKPITPLQLARKIRKLLDSKISERE